MFCHYAAAADAAFHFAFAFRFSRRFQSPDTLSLVYYAIAVVDAADSHAICCHLNKSTIRLMLL